MAETRLANVIVPEVFTQYTMEPSIYRSRFFNSGALVMDQNISNLLAGGGETYNLPYWKDTVGTTGDVPSETVDATVNAITSGKQVFRKQTREKVWGANDISSVFAGSDGINAAAAKVAQYWGQAFDQLAIKTMQGVIAENIDADSSDLCNVTASVFDDDGVITAQALLGENGTLGRGDDLNGEFSTILVHPNTYALMRKQDLIDFVPISGQARPVPFYMNMSVIVDRNAPVNSTLYDTYILKSGALRFGQTDMNYLPTEIYRNPKAGFGIDELYTRRVFGIHPGGFQWLEASVAGVTPTDAELINEANWDRTFSAENCGFVMYRHTLS
jgi:hypothetical protein